MLSYNDTTEKPSPERSRDEASFYVIYKTYPNLTTTVTITISINMPL